MLKNYQNTVLSVCHKVVAISALLGLVNACSGGGGDDDEQTPLTSADVTYTSVSVMGSNINDPVAFDAGPEISSNYLELYFFSDRAGGSGGMDIYVSTRAMVTDPWGAATNVTALNSMGDDRQPSLSSDGLTMYFASDRAGGEGGSDIYVSTRATLMDAWSAPVNLGNVVNTVDTDSGPSVSDDGLSLYFQSNRAGTLGQTDLYVTTRATTMDSWGAPTNMGATINTAEYDVAPDIASDGLSLLFHSTRTGGVGVHDIWRATRASTSDSWGAPVNLGVPVNSIVPDTAPGLSDDWQTLYFASDAGGNRDIWEATP